jgi:cytochrome P450
MVRPFPRLPSGFMPEVIADDVLTHWAEFDQDIADDPYPLYARVRDRAPVRRVLLGDGRPAWLICGYEEARRALTDPRLSKDLRRVEAVQGGIVPPGLLHPLTAYHMLSSDPPEHTRLRQLAGHAFTPSRMEALRPRVQAITDGLLDAMEGQERVDLVASFAFPLPITVICELLGVPVADRDRLRAWFHDALASPLAPANDPPAWAAADRLGEYLHDLVAAKRAEPAEDLFSLLAAGGDGDGVRLDEDELLSTAWILVLAGHETTVNLIANGMTALLRHPDQLARLRGDLSLVPTAVEEFLRYDAPVQHATYRVTTVPVEIGGVEIPALEQVLVVLAAADRDPARFACPDALDVGREDNRHLAFGHGIHFCLGAPLARLEGQIAFTSLLRRFPNMALAVAPEELHWTYRLVLRAMEELPVLLRGQSGPTTTS